MVNVSTIRILCVDDEINILHTFNRTLGREFKLHTAASAESALTLLAEYTDFAVIVSDFNMPEINGLEFLKLAQKISPDSVQIMLTGNIDPNVSITAINETNIFRYLPKPCAMEILRKVVLDAIQQHSLLTEKRSLSLALEQKNLELAASYARLSKKKYLLEYELEMAKTVYSNIVSYDQHALIGLDYRLRAKDDVGGDFLLTYSSLDKKSHYLMMGDVAGHGLQSALAVLLVSDCFEFFCSTQPEITQLAESINEKMCAKLPKGLFCAAFLIKLDLVDKRLYIWHGGMPNAFFLNAQGQIIKTLYSNNLPLGVLAGQNFVGTDSCHSMSDAQSLFLHSDGVTEQKAPDQTMFGDEHLKHALTEAPSTDERIDFVMTAVNQHQQQETQSDDISLLQLNLSSLCNNME